MSDFISQASHGEVLIAWHSINWSKCYRIVRSLQRRIVEAVDAGLWRKAKRLSYILTRSFSARALAVKRVTENSGKKTAGVDGEIWNTPLKKAGAIHRIGNWKGYRPKPLKRNYIPKKNGKKRPLGIPTMEDRARQALYKQALEPIAETQADGNSYGFRPKRSCADAIDQCFKVFRLKNSAEWILEGDIKGFFDHISFEWMVEHIPMNKRILEKWLKCGFVERKRLFPTESGVPQGGIISPVLSNMVLDGLEEVVTHSQIFKRTHKINFIRYADDFIVSASSKEILQKVITPRIESFLSQRGVKLSREKSKITHISEGFDFLGQTIRKYRMDQTNGGKLQITPSQTSMKAIKTKIKEICKSSGQLTTRELIDRLNPVLRGWANYHRHVICNESFGKIDSYVWIRLYRWAKKRHGGKTGAWIYQKYFRTQNGWRWCFTDKKSGKNVIRIAQRIKAQSHIKIKADANPFDAKWENYFAERDRMLKLRSCNSFQGKVFKRQEGICPVCKQRIEAEAELDLHHWDGNHSNNKLDNVVWLHPNCHRQLHYSNGVQRYTAAFPYRERL